MTEFPKYEIPKAQEKYIETTRSGKPRAMYELKQHHHSRMVPIRPPWTAMEIAGVIVKLHTIATKDLLEFLVEVQERTISKPQKTNTK